MDGEFMRKRLDTWQHSWNFFILQIYWKVCGRKVCMCKTS